IEVTYIPVNEDGLISPKDIKKALKKNTVLVSVMYVNNEIGTVQPIKEISEILKEHSAYFHVDAVQAANYLNINVKDLGVDLMTLSGHKIYGPKGSAILYKKEDVNISPIVTGGEQERKLSAGTENVPAFIGFAEALKETEELKEKESKRVGHLRDIFIEKILSNTSDVGLNGSKSLRIPNNINVYFKNTSSEILIPKFDAKGLLVSGGSACTSRTPEPSHVIEALGRKEYAKNSIRITLGRHTTEEDINKAADIFIKIAKQKQ
ncbi:MAG: cysteine desulfurase family protein, partial [Candidatus Spechtbacterales bacterium]|nr:cysteine desulfurase family protein [Candidatus Spechtbacterales bacterium]